MTSLRFVSIGSVLALASVAFVAACQTDLSVQKPCRNIPDGGCPAFDDACEDPSCTATYSCQPDDTWHLEQTCPAHDAGASNGDAGSDAATATGDAGALLDVPGATGGPGCGDLETPDCSLGVAAACGNGCCDCQDLFVCRDGGWDIWGSCGDAGIVENQ
ncbi:MAG TPA: hypothetical protein VF407_13070 [Polyangiaceae bacterium]